MVGAYHAGTIWSVAVAPVLGCSLSMYCYIRRYCPSVRMVPSLPAWGVRLLSQCIFIVCDCIYKVGTCRSICELRAFQVSNSLGLFFQCMLDAWRPRIRIVPSVQCLWRIILSVFNPVCGWSLSSGVNWALFPICLTGYMVRGFHLVFLQWVFHSMCPGIRLVLV